VECHETGGGCLCANVEQFRAGEVDDVLEERRRHCGEFWRDRDKHLLAEPTVVIFCLYCLQRVTKILLRRHKRLLERIFMQRFHRGRKLLTGV
jgi:hypothetical protein